MTRDVIMQFMWGYQGHFRLALERLGRDCIGELSPDLHPRALLIGLRTPDSRAPTRSASSPRMATSRRDCSTVSRIAYKNYSRRTDSRTRSMGMRLRTATSPGGCVPRASGSPSASEWSALIGEASTTSFCGKPAHVNGFGVVPVIQVNAVALKALPRLQRTSTFVPGFEIVPSLAHAVIDCLLLVAHGGLCAPDPGRGANSDAWLDGQEVLRRAAKAFSYSPTCAGGKIEALGELFDRCCA